MSQLVIANRRSRTRRGSYWRLVRLLALLLLTSVYLYPFVFMIATALKPESEYFRSPAGWPTSLTLSHLAYAWSAASPSLGRAMLNSVLAVSVATVLCCAITSMAAFWFLRNKSKVSRALLAGFGSLWLIPQVVWVIPLFLILSTLQLTDNLIVLGVVYGAVSAPGFVWLLWAYFLQGVPEDVLQAAEVDGASMFQQYWRIVLPLSLPALASVAALTFIFSWGDLLLAVVLLQDPGKFTVALAAGTLVGRYTPAVQDSAAAALITIAPNLIVFLVAQKAIVRGITGGFGK